jgi:DNA helicase HerA-like ATPase
LNPDVRDTSILVGRGEGDVQLLPEMANRHGLVAGATGTGKTITLQVLAEAFSARGVPVFLADVKGDLAGISQPGQATPRVEERRRLLGLQDEAFAGCPVTFWDVFGEQGHPVRATISEMGPLLLSRLLQLNETQAGVLNIVFRLADEHGLLLLDLKDLRALLIYAAENASALTARYGNVSAASVGAVQRALLVLEHQGGDRFFGEPALNLDDLLQTDGEGRGIVNILAADRLMLAPKLYATFLLWMLAELFERLPEVGDLPQPKLVYFFDEAHLLFDEAPRALLEKVEQVVRLVRSKGVGVYFVTQNPQDVPPTVLAQLGNRVQHALRAFTPKDQAAIHATARTFRPNPGVDVETVLTTLGVGEALVSMLDARGEPSPVQRALIRPPRSQIGPIAPALRQTLMQGSVVAGVYDTPVDRESASEILARDDEKTKAGAAAAQNPISSLPRSEPARGGRRPPETILESMARSTMRTVGSTLGREIVRGLLGSIFGGRRR